MRLSILGCAYLLVLVCCESLEAQKLSGFRILDLSLYANGSPRLAIGRRARLQTATSDDGPFSEEIEADTPLFVFARSRGRLLVSRLQEGKYLDDHGFWVNSTDCIIWASRFFYYPKRDGAISRSFDLMWRLDGSGRKWKALENGRFYGYPRVNRLSETPPVVLYDFGLLCGQDLASDEDTRELLAIEQPDHHDLYVLVTKAEMRFVVNRLFDLDFTYPAARDKALERAADEGGKARAVYAYIDRLLSVRNAFAAIGLLDIRPLDDWIEMVRAASVKTFSSEPTDKIYAARERWKASAERLVDGLIRLADLPVDAEEPVTLQHYTFQWFPDRGLQIGAFDNFLLNEKELRLWDELDDKPTDERRTALLHEKNPDSSLYVDASCFALRVEDFKAVVPTFAELR